MLLELRIRDFAIIDALDLRFDPGLVVLTGETGAGKSIIVDAVELVLGEWADSTAVRAGADRTLVEAVFRLEPGQQARIEPVLKREGLEGDDAGLLLLGREVRLNRRNICRVNGRAVTLTLLRDLTAGLVDIHGQSEHLSLLQVPEHLNLLDRYGALWPLRRSVSDLVRQIEDVRRELRELRRDERDLAHRADLLKFQMGEIAGAGLEVGEEEQLREERPRLVNAERLAELTREVTAALEVGESPTPSVMDLFGVAIRSLAAAAKLDPSLEPLLKAGESTGFQVEELARQVREYQGEIEYSPQRLRAVEERLALIHRLKRKYGETIEDVLGYAEEAERELQAITHSDERILELEEEEQVLLARLGSAALELSSQRRRAAEKLIRHVERELADLSMEGARFGMTFEWRPDSDGVPLPASTSHLGLQISSSGVQSQQPREGDRSPRVAFERSGIDRAEFLVSANPGEPLKPMARVASGGETSRLMLALKAVLSQVDETPTLIFDEIDQGIGGRVGATVGEKLWGLAAGAGLENRQRQVLCVTHLPQLASFGDQHLRVEKRVEPGGEGERTVTRVDQMEGDDRVTELAQMLGGIGKAASRSAQEILARVEERKTSRATSGR